MKELKGHYTEAKLVSLLEKKGIGRPSTFSSIISKIEERGYVKKGDVKGVKVKCVDYELTDDEISEIENTKTIGGEKNKMILEPIGKIVIEFLINKYNNVFEYDYTKNMENELDKIAKGKKIWHTLCHSCYTDIQKINSEIKIHLGKYEPINLGEVNKNEKYFVFSGIGNHKTFIKMLSNYGLDIIENKEFPDHYNYKIDDIEKIISKAKKLNSKILTTKKDYLRLNKKYLEEIKFIEVELKIIDENKFIETIL